MKPKITVVIPTFNEEQNPFFVKTLKRVAQFSEIELLCVDRKSSDGTIKIAQEFGFETLTTHENSRAGRLNLGIAKSSADFLVLHHPRSLIEESGWKHLLHNISTLSWGGFRHQFDIKGPLLNWTSWYSNTVRSRVQGILYLDHCIFFPKKDLLREIPNVDIFEDTELSKILRVSGKPVILPFTSKTSAQRFVINGVFKQSLMNQILKMAYLSGASDKTMNKMYEKGLSLNSKY